MSINPNYSTFIQFLQSTKKDYFYYSAVFDADPTLIPLILDYYPEIIFQKNYYSGTNYLFKKSNIKPNNSRYYEKFNHSINNISFSIDAEYSKNYVIKLSEIIAFLKSEGFKVINIIDFSCRYVEDELTEETIRQLNEGQEMGIEEIKTNIGGRKKRRTRRKKRSTKQRAKRRKTLKL